MQENIDFVPDEKEYPYFTSVPLERKENKEYRKALLELAKDNLEFQQEEMRKCEEDSLYWLASYCMLYEPRPTPKIMAFLPWDHQIPCWKTMDRWLGYRDFGIEKSRGEGASWMVMMLLLHRWLYVPMFTAGVVSKDEPTCDNPNNPDSLFWKLDWQLTKLPYWMVPDFTRVSNLHVLKNKANGATITGFAATENVASGGRKTVFVMDEIAKWKRGPDRKAFDSTQHVTESRFLISTPFGPDGAYYDAMHQDANIVKSVLHWSMNPSKNPGMYHVEFLKNEKRRIVLDDIEYWRKRAEERLNRSLTDEEVQKLADEIDEHRTDDNAFGYPFFLTGDFVKHGKPRSPWYDKECLRAGATPRSIAQELDLDYGGSSSRFFDISMIEMRQRAHCRPPEAKGQLLYPQFVEHYSHLTRPKFVRRGTGDFWLWCDLDLSGTPGGKVQCVVGADIGAGTGGVSSSNSSLTVLERVTGKQLAVFASPNILPERFAEFAVAVCYFFQGPSSPAMLIWEANGPPGMQFTKRIAQLEYNYVYLRSAAPDAIVEKTTRTMGWWSNNKTKAILLGEFARALDAGDLVLYDEYTLEEAKYYMNLPGGKIEHVAASSEADPSGAGERHGDRVIGAALAWWLAKEYQSVVEEETSDPPPNSFLGRRYLARKQEMQQSRAYVPRSARRHRIGVSGDWK